MTTTNRKVFLQMSIYEELFTFGMTDNCQLHEVHLNYACLHLITFLSLDDNFINKGPNVTPFKLVTVFA